MIRPCRKNLALLIVRSYMKHFSIFGFLLLQITRPDTGDREGHVIKVMSKDTI